MSRHSVRVLVRKKPDRESLQLYFVDPLTGKDVTRSARTSEWKEAERAAAAWEAEVSAGLAAIHDPCWDVFRIRFEDEHATGCRETTRASLQTAFNAFERLIGHPRRLSDVSASVLSKFVSCLRHEGKPDTTIRSLLARLRVAIRWAARMEMIRHVPHFPIPRIGRRSLMRGRAITTEEYERFLSAADALRPDDAQQWKDLITGLWFSGLRIDEARRLTWDLSSFCVDLTGKHPRFRILEDGQKSGRDELLPMAPEFAEWALSIPSDRRSGYVFPLVNPATGERFTRSMIVKTVSSLGEHAGIVANIETKKHASAHDLRRSFGVRWARRVKPLTLQRMMRHASLDTTLRYYVDLGVADVEADIWGTVPEACEEERPKARQRKPRRA